MKNPAFRLIFFIWLAWALAVIGFQAWAVARFQPQWPDRALEWTERETKDGNYQEGHFYLLEPFMNSQVAWDSEYYLGIAVGGYDDPNMPHTGPTDRRVSLSYAFLPFYPLMIRIFAYPLSVFGLNPIATAALAGVIVSALGTLAGMLALHDLTRDLLGEDGALRAAFYLIVFPTGFFLVQVYTEGLFVGLAFTCLAMLRRKKYLPAALLAICATLTRAVGVALVVPTAITWLRTGEWVELDLEWRQIFFRGIPLRPLGHALIAFAPLAAFLVWKFSYLGLAFDFVESEYFGRGFMNLGYAFYAWGEAFKSIFSGNSQTAAYYLPEFLGLFLGFYASFKCLKTDPEIAWFSLAVVLISWGSGPAQGIYRYVLGAPAVFYTLARWGRNPVFDRIWTTVSILLMGILAALYAFNMWVG